MIASGGPFKAAAVMAAPVFLDQSATVAKACGLIEEAADHGAALIAFPEVFIPGYPYWIWLMTSTEGAPLYKRLYANAVTLDGPAVAAIGEAAARAKAYVVMGCSERDGGSLYNTLLYFDPAGALMGRHRKLQPTNAERTIWGMGDGSDLRVFDTDLGKLSGLICWEHTMDLARYALISMGEQIHIGAWPGGAAITHNPRAKFWSRMSESLQRGHAISGQTFVISVQSPVAPDTLEALGLAPDNDRLRIGGGWSAIINPWGEVIAGPLVDEEGILYADIDLSEIVGIKYLCDSAGHYARPDVLRLEFDAAPKPIATPLKRSTD